MDRERRSPLLLAALRGGKRSMKTLLESGANVSVKDNGKRNVLHFLVAFGKPLTEELNIICNVRQQSDPAWAGRVVQGADVGFLLPQGSHHWVSILAQLSNSKSCVEELILKAN